MRTRAPGKVVISGAYAVLEGATAIVSAVNRYVLADTTRAAIFVGPELERALGGDSAPYVDVSALRHDDRKLGLGSSAAIVVACLAAKMLESNPSLDDAAIAELVLPNALRAHREAQGGGSGIDVLTSALGKTQRCWLASDSLQSEEHKLPEGVQITVHSTSTAVVTSDMLAAIRAYKARAPGSYTTHMMELHDAARRAAAPTDSRAFGDSVRTQVLTLASLGDKANVPIVPQGLRTTATRAYREDGVVIMPSGAGGGDIVLCIGQRDACDHWAASLDKLGMMNLKLELGARGVHRCE